MIETTQIGRSDVRASRIALGTWAIGGAMWGGTDKQKSIETIRAAIDRGISLIDTAPVYGFGTSEELVGEALRVDGLRERVAIATKAGLEWTQEHKVFRNSGRSRLHEEVEHSLRRLRTDRIDLYQIHWPDLDTPFEETAHALADILQSGKIRAIGVSNFSPQQIDAIAAIVRVESIQPPFNLFERDAEREIIPYASDRGMSVLCYGALCRGLLSGKIDTNTRFSGDDLRKDDPKFSRENLPHYVRAVEELRSFARERFDKSVLALAVRWILDAGPTIALWGARRPDQLEALSEIEAWHIGEDDKREIDAILARCIPQPIGPEFMAPPEHRPT